MNEYFQFVVSTITGTILGLVFNRSIFRDEGRILDLALPALGGSGAGSLGGLLLIYGYQPEASAAIKLLAMLAVATILSVSFQRNLNQWIP